MANDPVTAVSSPLFPVTPAQYGPEYTTHLFKQYRIAVATADSLSERRTTTNEFYFVLIAVVLSIAGAGLGGKLAGSPALPVSLVPWVSVIGIFLSVTWFLAIRAYADLNSAKFAVINELESRLPARVFECEWRMFTTGSFALQTAKRARYTTVTRVESVIPIILAVLFAGMAWYGFH
jgi:hypothetical protein